MSGFFEELKRRKVYRVAVAYVVAAGGVIQLASAVFPAWELPNWTLRLTIMLLLVGFPLALVLAWAFDVTPEGIRATPQAGVAGASRHRRRNIFLLVAVGLVVSAGAGFFYCRARRRRGWRNRSPCCRLKISVRTRERAFCRWYAGRHPDESGQDRRAKGDLAHLGDGLSREHEKRARNREGARRGRGLGRERAAGGESGALKCAAYRYGERSAPLGRGLRS